MIVAKLAVVLWGVILVFVLAAWFVVEGICQLVRRINQWEVRRDHQTRRNLGARTGSTDG